MSYLKQAKPIAELGQRNLWVIWGKSGSGKTELLSTFPKPMLYLQVGDDGSNTIANKEGIDALKIDSPDMLKKVLIEARLDKRYKSVATDTFSLIVNEWMDANAIKKNKRVTQQMWGDLKSETEEIIKLAHILAEKKIVILTCHEAADSLEGFEDEITPDVRPSVSKGARTYLEGMANYGIHTTLIEREKVKADGTIQTQIRFAAHLGQNPYYWVKTQKPKDIKLPKLVFDPTYDKIMKYMKGDK